MAWGDEEQVKTKLWIFHAGTKCAIVIPNLSVDSRMHTRGRFQLTIKMLHANRSRITQLSINYERKMRNNPQLIIVALKMQWRWWCEMWCDRLDLWWKYYIYKGFCKILHKQREMSLWIWEIIELSAWWTGFSGCIWYYLH